MTYTIFAGLPRADRADPLSSEARLSVKEDCEQIQCFNAAASDPKVVGVTTASGIST